MVRMGDAMKYSFGPIKSRRYGWSLGIDVMPKLKTCTYNCVYCELGKTSLKGYVGVDYKCEVPAYFSEDLKTDLRARLIESASYINAFMVGYNGEPTLNPNLKTALEVIRKMRVEFGIEKIPIAILTNSSTLGNTEIRQVLSKFDIVVAKLDAGTQEIFNSTNNPHYSVPSLEKIVKNLTEMKNQMTEGKKLYIQTLLYKVQSPSFLKSNATEENIKMIADAITVIAPDQVQVYTIKRPPAEPKVIKLGHLELVQLSDRLAELVGSSTEVFYFQ